MEQEAYPCRKIPTKTPLDGTHPLQHAPLEASVHLCPSGQDAVPQITGYSEPVPRSPSFLAPNDTATQVSPEGLTAWPHPASSTHHATALGPGPKLGELAPPREFLFPFPQLPLHRSPQTNAGICSKPGSLTCPCSSTSQCRKGEDWLKECTTWHCLALDLSRTHLVPYQSHFPTRILYWSLLWPLGSAPYLPPPGRR